MYTVATSESVRGTCDGIVVGRCTYIASVKGAKILNYINLISVRGVVTPRRGEEG